MRKVSLERYYFVLYNGALTFKMSKIVLFCNKTLHLYSVVVWHIIQTESKTPDDLGNMAVFPIGFMF